MAGSYVDLGVSVSTDAQSSIGGGNIINAAPIFGNQSDYTGGSNSGDAAASNSATTAQSPFGNSAAGGSSAGGSGTVNSLAHYLPYIIIAAGLLMAALFIKMAFKKK